MTQADVCGLGMNIVFPETSRETVKRNVPSIRLADKADLREIYKFGRKLGQGSFGAVYEATHIKTQTKWAIKEVYRPAPGSSKVKMLENEINILKQVNHAHIIQLQEIYDTPKITYLVTELCVGGELKQLLKQKKFFSEDDTRQIIRSLADAVVYLHKRDIAHRDLKLENILVKDSLPGTINIKVIDFGLSVQTGGVGIENMMTEACGTLLYMAPEIMCGRSYSWMCDVWSIGVIMYMLLCGEPPYVSNKKAELLDEIMHKGVQFTQPIWDTVSDAAKNVLTCLLREDPAYRMSAHQLLETPWITGDTNGSAIMYNVLEMMRHHLKEEERIHTPEDSLDQSVVPEAVSTETASNDRNHSPESDSSCTPSRQQNKNQTEFSKQKGKYHSTKKKGGSLKQEKHRNGSETARPPRPTTTQSRARVKPSTQLSAEQCRPQEKKDICTGCKTTFENSKTGYLKPTIAFKNKTVPPENNQPVTGPVPFKNKLKK